MFNIEGNTYIIDEEFATEVDKYDDGYGAGAYIRDLSNYEDITKLEISWFENFYICKIIDLYIKNKQLKKVSLIFDYVLDEKEKLFYTYPLLFQQLLQLKNVIFNIKIKDIDIFENKDFIDFMKNNDSIRKISYECDIDVLTDNMKYIISQIKTDKVFISSNMCEEFYEMLKQNKYIKSINVNTSIIIDEKYINVLLDNNNTLQEFSVKVNNISKFNFTNKLSHLALFCDDGCLLNVESFDNFISKCQNLDYLYLINDIDEKDIEKFEVYCKENKLYDKYEITVNSFTFYDEYNKQQNEYYVTVILKNN